MRFESVLASLCLFGMLALDVHASTLEGQVDTVRAPSHRQVRVYNTIRLVGQKPNIDGVLDDPCWKTGEWAGDFTQWVPREGAKPSQATQIKILYDDDNIYVAIRAFDNEPGKISRKLGNRDAFTGDVVGVNFDSYHDHRTGFEFDVTAAGQKTDLILTNPYECRFQLECGLVCEDRNRRLRVDGGV